MPTAMRSMMAIEDAEARYPGAFPRVRSAGEPPNAAMMDEEGASGSIARAALDR